MTYLTNLNDIPVPDQLPAGLGPDVPADLKAMGDSIDGKLTPYVHGNGDPPTFGIAPGIPGRRYRDDTTGNEYLDIGAAWVNSTPLIDPAAGTAGLRTLGTGATQATSGADSRLSDQRVPTAGSVDATKIANSLKPSAGAASSTEALRALGTVAGTAAAGNDGRFTIPEPARFTRGEDGVWATATGKEVGRWPVVARTSRTPFLTIVYHVLVVAGATFKVQRQAVGGTSWADIAGFGTTASPLVPGTDPTTASAQTDPTDVQLTNGDYLRLICVDPGAGKGGAVTPVVEYR